MKEIFTVTILLLSLMSVGQSKPDSVAKKISELKTAIEHLSKAIDDQKDERDTVAVVHLKKMDSIPVYDNDNVARSVLYIDSIIFDIRDGLILDMQVVGRDKESNKVFTNYWAPIAITRFNNSCRWLSSKYLVRDVPTAKDSINVKGSSKKKRDKSIIKFKNYVVKTEYYYINTCDFLNIIRKGITVPDNDTFTLNKQNEKKTLLRGTGINQVIDLRIFTDMFAALGDEANGLAQIEGTSRVFINNKNWFNRSTTPFRYGYFGIQASKLDSKFQLTAVDSAFSRLKAIQRSIVSAEVGLNLMGVWLQSKSRSWASLNGGAGLNLVRLNNETDTTLVTSQFLFLETLIEFKELNNFGIDFNGRVFWQKFSAINDVPTSLQPLLRLGVTAYWNPLKNPSSRIFARVNYFQDLKDNNDPFVQVQLGYSAVISSLLRGSKK